MKAVGDMHPVILELNDHEIRLARGTEIILRSPGYALVDGGRIILGDDAMKQSRLRPRSIYDQFWDRLDQDPLKNPAANLRHHADLAYSHLLGMHESAGKPEQILFAVPGKFSNQQLALLLGLAEAAPFEAVGLVDLATAAVAAIGSAGEYLHIDIHLHNAVLTQVTVADRARRGNVQIITGTGMSVIIDSCAYAIADLFIKQSRFDPQHLPETEQDLYNQIPSCLAALSSGREYLMQISHRQVQYQVWIDTVTLIPALEKHYQRIRSSIPAGRSCLLSDRVAALPGFSAGLNCVGTLDELATFQGCLANLAEICRQEAGPARQFVTSLPASASPRIHPDGGLEKDRHHTPQPSQPGITHVMYRGHAWPLVNGHIYLSVAGGSPLEEPAGAVCLISHSPADTVIRSLTGTPLLVNGRPASGQTPLLPGDQLSFKASDTSYTFICVAG